MQDDSARVPALLLCGGSNSDRDAAIARLAGPVPGGHPIAVLRAGSGMFASQTAPLGPHVVVKRAPIGCLCCTAGVVFRAALFGLLHASRPARLIVDLGPGDHVATLEAEFQGQSLGRVVRLVGRVDLDAHELNKASWPATA
jgi:hypothetical protein